MKGLKYIILNVSGFVADVLRTLATPLFWKSAVQMAKRVFTQDDKRKHFIVGFALSFVPGILSPLLGVCAAIVAGIVKEVYDATGRGCVEALDFAMTAIGAVCAVPFTLMMSLF